jgi:hypothetical protein
MNQTIITLHVGIWGGPSMGKTGVAQLVSGDLKRLGYQADYVSEYAKELVRANTIHRYDQLEILAEQHRREALNEGVLQVVVTDSPLPISLYHAKAEDREHFERLIDNRMQGWTVANYLVERDLHASYETEGRYENVEEALAKHAALKELLDRRDPYYVTLDTKGAEAVIVADVVRWLRTLAPAPRAA